MRYRSNPSNEKQFLHQKQKAVNKRFIFCVQNLKIQRCSDFFCIFIIKKKSIVEDIGVGYPKRLWMPHSWKCSRSSWTSLWTTCSLVKDVPPCGRKAGLDDLERFLPTQTTLTFTDQREHLHNLFKKGCKFLGLCACALEISIYRNETVTSSSLNS